LANALLYGAVLYLYSISPSIREAVESARKLVDKSLLLLNNEVKFERKEANVYVERTYGLYPYHIYLAMAMDVLSAVLLQPLEQARGVEEVSLAALAKFPLREPAATILSNEVSNVKTAVNCLPLVKRLTGRDMPTGVYIPLSYVLEIYESVKRCCERSDKELSCERLICDSECLKSSLEKSRLEECRDDVCEADKRNFVAHAGLERNAVCVKVAQTSGGVEIYVRYRKRCLEKIPSLLAPK